MRELRSPPDGLAPRLLLVLLLVLGLGSGAGPLGAQDDGARSRAGGLAVAIEPEPLRVVFERLCDVLGRGDPRTCTDEERGALLLGWLRVGRADRARAIVDAAATELLSADGSQAATGPHDTAAPTATGEAHGGAAHFCVQCYWLWRAERDEQDLRRHAAPLRTARARLLQLPLPATTVAAMLHVHGLACAAELARAAGDEHEALRARDRARALLDELEANHWREDRASFGDTDERASPFGCALGMLTATGNRMQHHLEATLAESSTANESDLVVRTQLDRERHRELARLCDLPTSSAAVAGTRLDAIGFATTGLRYAAGPGVDERWTRLRPCLLPGTDRVGMTGARIDGFRIDFEAKREIGATALRVTVTPRDPNVAFRQVVAHVDGQVFVAAACAGQPLALVCRDSIRAAITSSVR